MRILSKEENLCKIRKDDNETNFRIIKCFYKTNKQEVLEGTEIAFHWAHRDERTKIASVSKLCENTYNEKNIKKIDDEIEKCDLLCSGCHKQFQTQENYKKMFKPWEELIERGVPKPKDWDSWQQKEFN